MTRADSVESYTSHK